MRFTLAQLRKFSMPYSYEETLDLSNELNGFEDIISSGPCKVKTIIKERGYDTYLFVFDIRIELILEDSITLEGIPYVVETVAEDIFTTEESIGDAYIIEGITVDTKEAIVTAILVKKPMSISNAEFNDEDDDFDDDGDESINPAFASLKDLL